MSERRSAFDDPRLLDYVDGRLSPVERAAIAAELRSDPALAAEVEQIRHDTEMLQGIDREVLDEPVPARLRAVLRPAPEAADARRGPTPGTWRQRLARAAAIVLLFTSGLGTGWIMNDFANPGPSLRDVVLANAGEAFDFYRQSDGYPLDFPADRAEDFRAMVSQVFEREIDPPDLQELGYAFEGGRMMPTAGVRVGSFQFSSEEKGQLGVFFWPDDEVIDAPFVGGDESDLAYRVWSGNGFAIAVMGSTEDLDLDTVAETVFAFYEDLFGTS